MIGAQSNRDTGGKGLFLQMQILPAYSSSTTILWHAHFRNCGYTIGSVNSGPNSISASFPHFFQVLSQITLSLKHLSDNPINIKSPPLTLNDLISNNAADICFFPCYAIHQMWAKLCFIHSFAHPCWAHSNQKYLVNKWMNKQMNEREHEWMNSFIQQCLSQFSPL